MKQLHQLQLEILKKLLFAKGLRYKDLKPNKEIENNQLQFHLDKLVEAELIDKKDDLYSLSLSGKEYANRIDTEGNNTKVIVQAKIGIINCCIRKKDGENEFLIYTRLKQPFYGYQGFASGKVQFGESIFETAKRELKEETNMEGEPELMFIRHIRNYSEDQKLLEDKFLYFCRIQNPKGDLKYNQEGKQEWVKESKLKEYLTNPIDDIYETIETLKNFNDQITFLEPTYIPKDF